VKHAIAARAAAAPLVVKLACAGAGALAVFVALAFLLLGWVAIVAGPGSSGGCGNSSRAVLSPQVPDGLRPLFRAASEAYGLGPRGAAILAAITSVESAFGRNMGPSSAGAVGWTQFMPQTWQRYGLDADGDGRRDPLSPQDAIMSAARYLRASGAPADWYAALFAYNHADWYVDRVLRKADTYLGDGAGTCVPFPEALSAGVKRLDGGGRIVPIPGFAGERIDERLLPDITYLVATYRVAITAGYATSGHAPHGEHPLGLAVDLIPGPGGSWDDVDRLAHWAEPRPNAPRPPFRFVGYDGDPGHGRGNHLHLSWDHAPAPDHQPPATWVLVLDVDATG